MRVLILVFALASSVSARSQSQQPQQQPPAPCVAQEFRQFDFWIGEWTVAGPDGKEQGQNRITREAGGCAINEHWQAAGGAPGVSINYFDRGDSKWHQHWVAPGGVLHLAGSFDGKAMVMSGERDTPQGRVRDRITWTPLADGRVSQQWDTSTDGGKSWKTTFLGYYTRRANAKAEGK